MENLYSQNPAMTLRPDYKAALLELCGKILHWFSNVFVMIKSLDDDFFGFLTQKELSVTLWEEIKKMDLACQRFTVVIEAKENGETCDDESSVIEEVSDEDMDDIMESKEEQGKENR
jgi:hypothetical protein